MHQDSYAPVPPLRLRYVDFICALESVQPVMAHVQSRLSFPCSIDIIPAPHDQSGPREEEAVGTFSHGVVDMGRM